MQHNLMTAVRCSKPCGAPKLTRGQSKGQSFDRFLKESFHQAGFGDENESR